MTQSDRNQIVGKKKKELHWGGVAIFNEKMNTIYEVQFEYYSFAFDSIIAYT